MSMRGVFVILAVAAVMGVFNHVSADERERDDRILRGDYEPTSIIELAKIIERWKGEITEERMNGGAKLSDGSVTCTSSIGGGAPHAGQQSHIGQSRTGIVTGGGGTILFAKPNPYGIQPPPYLVYHWNGTRHRYECTESSHVLVFPSATGNTFIEAVPTNGTGPTMTVINMGSMANTNP